MMMVTLLVIFVVLILVISFLPNRWFSFWREEIEERAALIQLLVMIVLIFTLAMYWESNELNRKAAILSHTPWLSAEPDIILQTSPDDKSLVLEMAVQNTSDSPIFDFSEQFALFLTPNGPDSPNMAFRENPTDKFHNVLMPHDTRGTGSAFTSNSDGGAFSAAKEKADIDAGKKSIAATFFYTDIFREKMTLQVLIRKDIPSGKYAIFSTKITGYTTY